MNWINMAPEFFFVCISIVFFTFTMIPESLTRRDYLTALFLAMAGVPIALFSMKCTGTIGQAYRIDLFSQVIKVLLSFGFFFIIAVCSQLNGIRRQHHPEFYLLLSISTLAMMILVSSMELITVYVSLELSSYSLYLLVALRKSDERRYEAAIKYFIFGAATSAVMVFGMAALYGSTGTTQLPALFKAVQANFQSPLIMIGLLLTLSGFFFKLAVVPFHFWAPAVFQGAANQAAAYIATASKVTAVAMLLRFASLGSESPYLIHVLLFFAVISMILGNLSAMVQKDLKRLFAFSAIAQAGYILIGVLSMSKNGFSAAIFYAAAYLLMNYACFLVVVKVASDGSNPDFENLAGLHIRSPLLAAAVLVGVFSLGGIPPTVGFSGKFLIFTAAMEKGHFYLVLFAMFNVTISLYYYILVVKAAYFTTPVKKLPPIRLSVPMKALVWAVMGAIIIGGIYPDFLYSLSTAAAGML